MTTVQSKAMSREDFLSLQSFAKAYGLMNTPIDRVIPRIIDDVLNQIRDIAPDIAIIEQ